MLVLTRKLNEQILIGNDIKITLIRVRGNTVRLGIEAPRDVRVVRSELDPHGVPADDEASQIGEREGAFAHPVAPPKQAATEKPSCRQEETSSITSNEARVGAYGQDSAVSQAKGQPINRMAGEWVATEASKPGTNTKLFVGSVGRDGSQPRLKRAPLTSFLYVGSVDGGA